MTKSAVVASYLRLLHVQTEVHYVDSHHEINTLKCRALTECGLSCPFPREMHDIGQL